MDAINPNRIQIVEIDDSTPAYLEFGDFRGYAVLVDGQIATTPSGRDEDARFADEIEAKRFAARISDSFVDQWVSAHDGDYVRSWEYSA